MRIKVRKWGKDLGVLIPWELAAAAGIKESSVVELEVEGEQIRIKLRRPALGELVQAMTEDNVHCEADWGSPLGKEIW